MLPRASGCWTAIEKRRWAIRPFFVVFVFVSWSVRLTLEVGRAVYVEVLVVGV